MLTLQFLLVIRLDHFLLVQAKIKIKFYMQIMEVKIHFNIKIFYYLQFVNFLIVQFQEVDIQNHYQLNKVLLRFL